MTQRRDSKGRFASGTGARAGQIKGIVARKAREGGKNALRNTRGVAASTGSTRGVAGFGVRMFTSGKASVAGHTVGGGTARTVSRKISAQKLNASRRHFKAMPPASRKQVTRGQRRYLGPMR